MRKHTLWTVLAFALSSPHAAFGANCPDFSGKYKIADLKDCTFEHYHGDRLIGDKVPPFDNLYIARDSVLEIKQNGCESAEYTLAESGRPDLLPTRRGLRFRPQGDNYAGHREKVKFTQDSFIDTIYRSGASSNEGQAIPLPSGGIFHGKWGFQKEKDGSFRMFASGEGAGFLFIFPLVQLYNKSCRFVPVAE